MFFPKLVSRGLSSHKSPVRRGVFYKTGGADSPEMSNQRFNIRRYRQNDADPARNLVKFFKHQDISCDYIKSFLTNPANYLIVAEVDEEPVGFLLGYANQRIETASNRVYIHEIAVTPAYRRQGIGIGLVEYIRQEMEKDGIKKCFLITQRSNRGAVKFYTSIGFQIPNEDDVVFVSPG